MDEIHDEHVINEFIAESFDHLESIEPDLLTLEQHQANIDVDILNRIFRAMHSIKGASSFFGFESLTRLSHAMENVFMKFRHGELKPNADRLDPIFEGIDKIRLMLNDVYASHLVPCENEVLKLNAIAADSPPLDTPDPPPRESLPASEPDMTDVSQDTHESLIFEYVAESMARLSDINTIFISLKQPGATLAQEDVVTLYKMVVHIRVGANYLKFNQLFELSKRLEMVFSFYRESSASIPAELKTVLFECLGKLWEMVENIDTSDKMDCKQLLLKLDYFLDLPMADERDDSESGAETQKEKVPPPTEAPVLKRESAFPPPSTPDGRKSTETIRVSVTLIDNLMNLAGELVLGRNQLRQELESIARNNPKLNTIIQDVDAVTSEIQEDIMQMRMQPVGNLFNKFSRIVRDLARQLSKEVELVIDGKDVELDKTMLEGLSDPLTHLIRNSLDHGIELPADREKKGKSRVGKLHVSTFHEGGQVNIIVKDDGKGINPDVVLRKAIENGSVSADRAAYLSDYEKMNLIMMPGFSTAEAVTDISGRGVGMDVVKTNIETLGGQIELDSEPDKGTMVRIRLPLTLAIIPSLIVGTGALRFAIPQVNVQELFLVRHGDKARKIEKIGESQVLRVRERLLPLVNLSEVLGIEKSYYAPHSNMTMPDRRGDKGDRREPDISDGVGEPSGSEDRRNEDTDRRKSWRNDINVVVLKIGLNSFGLIVDKLYDNEEIVVKPMSTHIKDCKCFAGATIMGDGRVAMILDAVGIAEYAKLNFAEVNREIHRRRAHEEAGRQSRKGNYESILLFNSSQSEFFAITLEAISRLEMIRPVDIYHIGNREYISYQNQSIPLVYLEDILPVKPFPKELNEYFMLVPKTSIDPVGIAVSRILDTIDINVEIKQDKTTPPGLLGTAFVNSDLTMFLNTVEILELIYANSVTV